MTPHLPFTIRRPHRTARVAFAALALALPLTLTLTLGLACATARAEDGGSWMQTLGLRAVAGSGTPRSESRAVSGFQAIALNGSIKLVLRQGAREALELRADDNLLPLIETRVVNRAGVSTLEIGPRRGTNLAPRSEVMATVDVLTLAALSVNGSGDVVCDELKTPALRVHLAGSGKLALRGLAADELALKLSGSGEAQIKGRAGKLQVSIAGSGDVDAGGLEADDVTVGIAGSGDVGVNARKTLAVSIAGSGDVAYSGTAVVTSSVAGSGRIRKR
jgi:hypothetical protein